MKTLRTFALLVSTAALLGLGGCATYTAKDVLAQFQPGENKVYAVVPGASMRLVDIKDFGKRCGNQELGDTADRAYNEWMKINVCAAPEKWQTVATVYLTKVWGTDGLRTMPALAPVSFNIERDDILELNFSITDQGRGTRPAIVTRVARKAKDATKESGCYWDGGKGATTAFIGGGAVCDGWNWRDQKFAKE
jgi:hypothetical protein